MIELNSSELNLVSGGDAAATRRPGTNSWGETPRDTAYNSSSPIRRKFDEWFDSLIGL